jgi:hypothetical protein
MARAPLDTPENYDDQKPNHMIFWLDSTIGNPEEYQQLKKAFGSNTDPRNENWTMFTDRDYLNILAERDAVTVTFEGVRFLLQAFSNEADCLAAFENNQDKRIFFITSGQMGKSIVPQIIEQYRHIFTDLITDEPYMSIYVFCHNIEFHIDWALEYRDYIHIFNFDSDLLERMTRDIAEYFIERGKRIRQDNDLQGALQRLYWAKKLWHQYDKMAQDIPADTFQVVRESKEMKKINELIAEIEAILPKESSDDDNDSNDGDARPSEPYN